MDKKPKIVADYREEIVISILEELGAEVERKSLDIGDFICSSSTAIERKTRRDFEISIIDQRLFKQLSQLRENFANVVLIVEGEVHEEIVSRAALLGAYASAITDFNASIFFTRNEKTSAEIIFAIAKHEQLAKKREVRITPKPKTLTLSQTQRSIIENLPLVGPSLAKKLLIHFGTIEKIATASEKELLDVEGIGEKKAKLIWKTLHHPYNLEEDLNDY